MVEKRALPRVVRNTVLSAPDGKNRRTEQIRNPIVVGYERLTGKKFGQKTAETLLSDQGPLGVSHETVSNQPCTSLSCVRNDVQLKTGRLLPKNGVGTNG